MQPLKSLPLALLLAAVAAPAAPPITKTEIRTADPEVTHRRLRDVVWDMFRRDDPRREERPKRPLESHALATRSRGTEIPDLCRYDIVSFEFAPVSRRDRGADTRVRAIGIEAESRFRFLSPPAAVHQKIAQYDRWPTEGSCIGLDTGELAFFIAPDATVATDGYLALINLQQSIRSGNDFPLQCDLFPVETQTCGALILSFDQDAVERIEPCDAPERGEECFRIRVYDRQLDILAAGFGEPEQRIVGAKLTSLIVSSHEPVD